MPTPRPRRSRGWAFAFRVVYRLLGALDPLIRPVQRSVGLGNVVELRVPGRRTGIERSVLVGLLRADGDLYLGHPNGEAAWIRNLSASGEATFCAAGGPPVAIAVERLGPGAHRDAAIRATWTQHPFPGNVIYWLARRHVLAAGVYFRVVAAPHGDSG